MTNPPVIKVEIVHIDGPLKGTIQEFYDPVIAIGRHPDCQITFPRELNDISRRHAEIRREGNRFMLVDQSTNGTRVNGKLMKECILKDGDVLTLSENGPKISILTTLVDTSELPDAVPEPKQTAPDPDLLSQFQEPPEVSAPPELPVEQVLPTDSAEQIPIQTLQKPFIIQFQAIIKSYDSLPVTLGSAPECDFVISHPAVLKQHARIYFTSSTYHIRDLTSRSLVSINGRPVNDDAPMPPDTCISLSPQGPLFQFIGEGRLAEIDVSQQPESIRNSSVEEGTGPDGKKKKSFWPFKKK